MDRDRLLGLCAMLNIARAELEREYKHKPAARRVNDAVVLIHQKVGWTAEDLARMGRVQNWVGEQLLRSRNS